MSDKKDHGGADAGVMLPRWAVEDVLKNLRYLGDYREHLIPIGLINLVEQALSHQPAPVAANASAEARLRATLIVVRDMIANEMLANAVTDIKTMKPLKDVVEEALIATSMVNNGS